MKTLSRGDLVRRSSTELGVLHDLFNKALLRTKPFSADWCRVMACIDAVQNERRERLEKFTRNPW
ncbi:hypothetical protein [Hyphomicrobium sp. MC8b]|uniref:hypothetical protein n=1 Tax=Hyphomicrobium sp. MC8b TaxID=300273 RepID=UPI00391C3AB1